MSAMNDAQQGRRFTPAGFSRTCERVRSKSKWTLTHPLENRPCGYAVAADNDGPGLRSPAHDRWWQFAEIGFRSSAIRGKLVELLRWVLMPVRRGNRNLVTAVLS